MLEVCRLVLSAVGRRGSHVLEVCRLAPSADVLEVCRLPDGRPMARAAGPHGQPAAA